MDLDLHSLRDRLTTFDIRETFVQSVEETKDLIIAYNRQQLLRGLDSLGRFLSPKYSEDPFFKSREAAQRYAIWKSNIEPKTDKPFDVPNLFINGRFHDSIGITVSQDEALISSDDPNAPSIEGKFSQVIYGLNEESKEEYITEELFPVLQQKIETATGLKLT